MNREQRFLKNHRVTIQRRADYAPLLVGYAAVFYQADDPGSEYELWPGLREHVLPGCFDRAIREKQDVRGLFNHDTDQVLGRLSAGTLRLSVDATGLRYEIDLPDTSLGRDLATSIDRGDITGSSFSFLDQRTTYVRGEGDAPDIRELQDVDLFDVGPVTFPAYESTTTGIRSADADAMRREFETWRAQQDAIRNGDEINVRLRILEIDRNSLA